MAPIDGPICTKINMCTLHTISNNISEFQPSKASGLGGVWSQSWKSPALLYKYRLWITFPLFWAWKFRVMRSPVQDVHCKRKALAISLFNFGPIGRHSTAFFDEDLFHTIMSHSHSNAWSISVLAPFETWKDTLPHQIRTFFPVLLF